MFGSDRGLVIIWISLLVHKDQFVSSLWSFWTHDPYLEVWGENSILWSSSTHSSPFVEKLLSNFTTFNSVVMKLPPENQSAVCRPSVSTQDHVKPNGHRFYSKYDQPITTSAAVERDTRPYSLLAKPDKKNPLIYWNFWQILSLIILRWSFTRMFVQF